MKKLRILILIRQGLEPPESLDGMDPAQVPGAPWKTEYDVLAALKALGHETRVLSLYSDLGILRQAIEEWKPQIAFNLMEEFRGVSLYDQNIVAFLELMGLAYTGCNPRGLMIARDKSLSKKLLAFHRIKVPEFAVFPINRRVRRPKRLEFPLFVKSVIEDASFAISRASLVKDDKGLVERVAFLHDQTGADAIVEEFIEGREFYVGVFGNRRLETLPVWEFIYENNPDRIPVIATARAKWSLKYQEKWGITTCQAKDLPDDLTCAIRRRCKRIYRILGLSGYARIDFRMQPDGSLFFLEANPNPNLSREEDYAESAAEEGIAYDKLIARIVNLGLNYQPIRL